MHVTHRILSLQTLLLVGLLLPLFCLADLPKTGDVIYWSDPTYIAVDSNRVFVSSYLKGVGMFDLSDPDEPEETLVLPWAMVGGSESGLAAAGNRLYTGTSAGDFGIYDIAVPAQPVLLSQVPMNAGVNEIFVRDTLAAVSDWSARVHLVNIANSQVPVEYTRFEPGEPLGFVDGYFCSIDENFGFQIWNISDPQLPVVAATAAFPAAERWNGGLLAGHLACCKRFDAEGTENGVRFIDLTNPLVPVLRGAIDDYNIWYNGLTVIDSVLYVSPVPGSGIHIWDISNLDNPVLTTTYAPTLHFGSLFTCRGRLGAGTLLAPHILGLYDVTNPAAPLPRSGFGPQATLTALEVSGEYLYASDSYGGLHIIDVEEPEDPAEIGLVDSVLHGYDVALEGNYAYVTGGFDGLQIVNIVDPRHPIREGRVVLANYARYVEISGNYAYVLSLEGLSNYWLYTVNISEPATPVVTDSLELGADVGTMARYESYLYLSGLEAGQMVSLAFPEHPTLVSDEMTVLRGRSLTVLGSLAYVTNGFDGWSIVSLSTPSAPTVVYTSGTATGRAALRFAGQGNHVYISSQLANVWQFQTRVYDVSDPTHPRFVDETPMSDVPAGPMALVGDYCYVTGIWGYSIYDCSGIVPNAVTPGQGASSLPLSLCLSGVYPNPFNPATTLAFEVPAQAHVRLAIYDLEGREVGLLQDGMLSAGHYQRAFDGGALPSGTYFCRLTSGGHSQTQKLLLLK